MHLRWVFTLDEDRFPIELMRQLVSTLHSRQQHYVVMVDPAVAYQDYDAFNNGVEQDVFMVQGNGSIYKGIVWPGVTAFVSVFMKARGIHSLTPHSSPIGFTQIRKTIGTANFSTSLTLRRVLTLTHCEYKAQQDSLQC